MALGLAALTAVTLIAQQAIATINIRGKPQQLRLYGAPTAEPVVVSSGDGGWIHLGPHVAEFLAANGYFVVGIDVRAYLASFTSGSATLRSEDEPGDYRTIVEFASRQSKVHPILIGVSVGAGLSVLAATDPATKAAVRGIIGLGVPELNELGWRWRDSIIYITKATPKEPTFSAGEIIDQVSPLPFAAIHSTRDEFVPVSEVQKILARAKDPKKL